MGIDEGQLETWAHQPSTVMSKTTYASIRNVLKAPNTPWADKDVDVFLQGSYENDTNVYGESDVDIVIQCNSVFYSDVTRLTDEERAARDTAYTKATYNYTDFKNDVVKLLAEKYTGVDPSGKAVFIPAAGDRRDADVLVAAQLRRYYKFASDADQSISKGLCFFANGNRIDNFPKMHSENCTTKHGETKEWFKPTVRIFKNLRNRLAKDGLLEKRFAPSYYLEGMLYNVPASCFGKSYVNTVSSCFDWISAADKTKLLCANRMEWLLRDNQSTSWPVQGCNAFLNAMAKLWRNW